MARRTRRLVAAARRRTERDRLEDATRSAAGARIQRQGQQQAQAPSSLSQAKQEKPDVVTIGTPDHWHVPIANRPPQRREPECGDGVPVPQDLPAQPPSARSLTGVSNPTGYHSTPPCMVITIRAVGNQISYRLKRAIDCPIIWGLADRYVQSIHAQLFERTTSWLTVLYKQKYYRM